MAGLRDGTEVGRLARAVADVADVLAGRREPLEVAGVVVRHCTDLVDTCAVGMLVAQADGGLQLLAASSPESGRLELFQLQVDEGPCLDAFASGEVLEVDTAAGIRRSWPRFAEVARAHGAVAVLTVPMEVGERRIGALNLFRDHEGPWSDTERDIACALAALAAAGVLQAVSTTRQDAVTAQLQNALNSRVVVEQAKGVLAERHHVHPDEAFGHLRQEARSRRERLQDVARRIVGDLGDGQGTEEAQTARLGG